MLVETVKRVETGKSALAIDLENRSNEISSFSPGNDLETRDDDGKRTLIYCCE